MSYIIIVTGSVTSALRLEKLLHSLGIINARAVHTPSKISSGGCSHSVRVPFSALAEIKRLHSEGRIDYKSLYYETKSKGGYIYRAVS